MMSKMNNYEIYKKLGAHFVKKNGKQGVHFAVLAPNAVSVSVIGEFNDWDIKSNVMEKESTSGIFSIFIPEVPNGSLYEYYIETQDGRFLRKADPFAREADLRPGKASKVVDLRGLKWSDGNWLEERKGWDYRRSPLSIYEAHIGSWRKHEDRFYTYREFAVEATEYIKEMGYTHIELIGIAEHPFDGSWGYQVTGYFAPTSRYGTPEDFAYMINYFHENGIGVILDWVPAHFAKDMHGLSEFDGTPVYEYADPQKAEHPEWGTKIFDYGKKEVRDFLIANALYWAKEFHIDGLRVDAVASMLYLDYGKEYGQYGVMEESANKNWEAVSFLKEMNKVLLEECPGVMVIAEESTAWPKVTGKIEEGSLGFDLKWNMGWMHDFLEYMKKAPYFRKEAHYNMTFAMSYAYNENYILVLSHDEVVHLKGSMLNKMSGFGKDKFENLKVGYAFMMGHAGKKLLFMGQDFAQVREWNEARELDWDLLSIDAHKHLQDFTKDLLHLYKENEAMYECDYNPEGFEWINADDKERSIYSFIRHSKDKKKNLLFVCNFTSMARPEYRVGVPRRKTYELIINSDEKKYGGTGAKRPRVYKAEDKGCDGKMFSITYDLPPFGVAVFEY